MQFQPFQNQMNSLSLKLKDKHCQKATKKVTYSRTSPKICWSILNAFRVINKYPVFPRFFMKINFLQKISIFSRQCTTMREKCPYSEIFWSAFSRIRTVYGEILRISSYSFRTRENTDQKNSEYRHFLRSAIKINISKVSTNYLRIKVVLLSAINFNLNYIKEIIQKFDPSIAHGHGMISTCILKWYNDSRHKLVNICVGSCIESGQFPCKWRETNLFSVHIKSK